jgi:hypothetical protein
MGAYPTGKATGGPGINRVTQNAARTPERQHSSSHLENLSGATASCPKDTSTSCGRAENSHERKL